MDFGNGPVLFSVLFIVAVEAVSQNKPRLFTRLGFYCFPAAVFGVLVHFSCYFSFSEAKSPG